jgi:hypothetical protein
MCCVSFICVSDKDNSASFNPTMSPDLARSVIAVFVIAAFAVVVANWRATAILDIRADGR